MVITQIITLAKLPTVDLLYRTTKFERQSTQAIYMSHNDFLEELSSFMHDVQQSVGFNSDGAIESLAKMRAALEPLRASCTDRKNELKALETHIAQELDRHQYDRTNFLKFDREASGYMSYADFERALKVSRIGFVKLYII